MSATPADQIDASNQPEMVDGFWTDRRWALLETLLVLAVFACHGACLPPDINEPHYLAKAKHFWNPAWCPLDFFLNSADAHQVFYVTFGWLTLWLPLPAVAWVGRIITWAVQAWGWRRLSVAIIPRPGMAVLSAALLVIHP